MEINHPALQFSANAAAMIRFRTGRTANVMTKDQIMNAVSTAGYFVHRAGDLAVLLIDQDHDCMSKRNNVGQMIKAIFTASFVGEVREVVVSIILHSSMWTPKRLSALHDHLSALRTNHPNLFVRLDLSGTLAFDATRRVAFATRPSLMEAYQKGGVPRKGMMLRTDRLTADDRRNYMRFLNDVSQVPPIEENDILCVWNGYRQGDLIWVENLSQNTVAALGVYRIIAPSIVKQKPEAETGEDE